IMNAPIAPPSRYRPEVPPQLDRIVARALCRPASERYATAEDMAIALEEVLLTMPRYSARAVHRVVEERVGSTRAEAKRRNAQTRSLPRNVSLVMKLRSEVRADLAEQLDSDAASAAIGAAAVHRELDRAQPGDRPEVPLAAAAMLPSRRGGAVALGGIMV